MAVVVEWPVAVVRGADMRSGRFEALYWANARAVLGYAVRRVDVAEDAADVVAQTFLIAWRRLDEVPAGDEARLWIFGVARRVLANHRRGERRRLQMADRLREELASQVGRGPLEERAEIVMVVREAMQTLSDLDREVLALAVWEGLTPMEIAAVAGIGAASARTRLHRARQRLRAELAARGVSTRGAGSDEPAIRSGDRERLDAAGHVHDGGPPPAGDEEER